jgi:ABC-type uncharacterized transport system substrate-binding protein
MNRTRFLVVASCLALAPPAEAAKVTLIVSDKTQAAAAAALAAKDVSVLAFDRARLVDPIEKGRFLATAQASDRIIAAAGGRACGWLTREIEGVPVYCVTPYDSNQVLDFAQAAGWRRVAAVYAPGYEKVYGRLRARARQRGVELAGVRIEKLRELPEALPTALKSAQAVWILGGASLTEGPAFEYLLKSTLARKVPLVAPGLDSVSRGAFLGVESEPSALMRHAVGVANAAAQGAAPDDSTAEVPGGRIAVNRVLARRWGVAVRGSPR